MEEDLIKLISFKTITGDFENNRLALSWIKEQIKDLPVYIKTFNSSGFSSLIIISKKTKKPKIWLVAHIDIVPASETMFKAKIVKRRLIGRGVYDMKYAIAAYIRLLKELGRDIKNYNIGIMITSDEEIGGRNGVGAILKEGYASEVAFIPDGGTGWKHEKVAKGVWQVCIESKGISNHGSRPWGGSNAVMNLFGVLREIEKQFPEEPCSHKLHYHDTMNVGKIEGGEAINKIPDSAKAFVDFRFIPETGIDGLKRKILPIINQHKKINIIELSVASCTNVDPENIYHKLFYKLAKEKYNIKTGAVISHGTSDARFFVENNIPVIVTRPMGGELHSDKEWIDLNDLERFYQTLKELIIITK